VKILGTIVVLFAIATLWGCGTSISTNYDYDVNANFETYRTYDWIPQPDASPGSAQAAQQRNDLLDKRIRNAVDNVFKDKGLSNDKNAPDMLVVYHVGVQDKVQVTVWGYRYSDSYWGYGGREIDVYNYQEGTLIVDLVDAQTKQLIWRGAGSTAIDDSNRSPEKSDQTINKVVGKVFSQYPPKR
jgi:hypothetical protein